MSCGLPHLSKILINHISVPIFSIVLIFVLKISILLFMHNVYLNYFVHLPLDDLLTFHWLILILMYLFIFVTRIFISLVRMDFIYKSYTKKFDCLLLKLEST
jgi:hypothetical protein